MKDYSNIVKQEHAPRLKTKEEYI